MKRTEYFREYYHRRKAKRTEAEEARYRRACRFKARIKRLGWKPEQAAMPVDAPLSPGYVSTDAVACMAGVTRDAICGAIRRGELRAVKVKFKPNRVRYEIHQADARYWATVLRS